MVFGREIVEMAFKALEGLRSVERLESEAEVADQVERVQQLEAALEAGHADFVALSQLAVDLVAKLDASNGGAANQIRRQIDTTTQRWDNIVSRIDQHSQMVSLIHVMRFSSVYVALFSRYCFTKE